MTDIERMISLTVKNSGVSVSIEKAFNTYKDKLPKEEIAQVIINSLTNLTYYMMNKEESNS